VIRDTIKSMDKVALASVVLTNREHVIALEPRGKGLVGLLLRYPYEVRDASEYFDDIHDVKITKDMLDLAKHIVEQKSGKFDPEKFEDHYEAALVELINRKRSGERIIDTARPRETGNVISLMDALKRSLGKEGGSGRPTKGKKTRKRIEGQSEMLLPISGGGKRAAKDQPKKAVKIARSTSRSRKAAS
jgi:DNA end-binding protein Ku